MPTLDTHPAASVVKLLNVGPSGSGKTGQLVSLVKAGYHLYILDYDKGLDIIANILRADGCAHLLKNVHYETISEKMVFKNGKAQVSTPPSAFKRAGAVLQEWKVDTLGPESVVVLDTLNSFSQAGFNEGMFLAGRLNLAGDAGRPRIQEYGTMADSVLLLIDTLTATTQTRSDGAGGELVIPGVDCHVIVNTHVKYLSPEDEALLASRDKQFEFTRALGVPDAKGQEISRNIAKYFNTVIYSGTSGSGPNLKRQIFTTPNGVIDVKTSSPSTVKKSYAIETGLAELFQDILGHGPPFPEA